MSIEDQFSAKAKANEELVTIRKADAKERATRTFKQGLLVTVGVAVITVLLQWLSVATGEQLISQAAWGLLVVSIIQTAASSALSYINRYTKTPEHTEKLTQ